LFPGRYPSVATTQVNTNDIALSGHVCHLKLLLPGPVVIHVVGLYIPVCATTDGATIRFKIYKYIASISAECASNHHHLEFFVENGARCKDNHTYTSTANIVYHQLLRA